jgi:hypothetical protein
MEIMKGLARLTVYDVGNPILVLTHSCNVFLHFIYGEFFCYLVSE